MRNLLCLLPDGHIPVTIWHPHPCGGYYMAGAWCYGPDGRVGRHVPGRAMTDLTAEAPARPLEARP